MDRSEICLGQRVRHVRKGFTGTVNNLDDPTGRALFGIKVDDRYIRTLTTNVNYHHGHYWAAALNLELVSRSQQVFHLVSPIFMEVGE